MRNRVIFLIIFFVLAVIAGVAVFFSFRSRRIPMNEIYTVGNTPGNLYNNGYFCESDGVVYFANPADNNCLYSMNPDETEYKKLTRMGASNINAGGDYLYYYLDPSHTKATSGVETAAREYGIYRSRLDGKQQKNLLRVGLRQLCLGGSYLYYMAPNGNGGDLWKMRIDREENEVVARGMINPSCYVNGSLYYAGVDSSHAIFAMDTANNNMVRQVYAGNFAYPQLVGDTIYYLDAENGYSLCSVNLTTLVSQVLTTDFVDTFNVSGPYIYYASAQANALKRMRTDGSENIVLMNGIFHSINVTSRYVYFKPYGDDYTTYHIPVGGGAVSAFVPETE
ncbi:MAG: DUF5050 domain-containing protein [Lachnospiraceae bacterium]|nr:DUF5050 domain-containing protein [Lachnospiraceae bacterium]